MVQSIVKQIFQLKNGVLAFKGVDTESILFIYQISGVVKNYLQQYKLCCFNKLKLVDQAK